MMNHPKVTIGIPVYNGARYLPSAIESVLAQDFEDFELVISDNASTDQTEALCGEYARRDSRIRYSRNPANIGAVPNFNRVFQLARGEFFKWLPYDDACYPSFLRRSLEVFDSYPRSVALVYPRCEWIKGDGSRDSIVQENVASLSSNAYQRLRRVLVKRSSAQALCGLIRSEDLRRTQLRRSFVMDDMGLLAELAMIGCFVECPETLLKIRIHEGNARVAHKDVQSHSVWLDPRNSQSRWSSLSPDLRLFLECYRSASYVDMSWGQRLLCCATIPLAYLERPLRTIGGRWRRRYIAPTSQTTVG